MAPRQRFCGSCGVPLGPAPAAREDPGRLDHEAPASTGLRERRRVSVVFCDIVGYTAMAEGQDPEEVRELLSGYYKVARRVVGQFGGTVEKFIGDAVMAVWGVPNSHEDDPERAVRAALELADAVANYGRSAGVELAVHLGVASGAVAAVEVAHEGLIIGDTVNLAARIQAAAPAGRCYVDDATQRLAEDAIAFEAAGKFQLKGIGKPVRLWRATRVTAGVGGRRRRGALDAPLLGREAELRSLKEEFHIVAGQGHQAVVVVSGLAGVGKSRLAWEFEKYVDGLVETVLWHHGRCLSYGEGVTFWPLAEIVRQRLAIAEEDTPAVAAAKLSEGLAGLVSEGDRTHVQASLSRLLGIDMEGPTAAAPSRAELFAGWRQFFEHLAGSAPVVLVVEDAEHADEEFLVFLEELAGSSKHLPILVLVLTRPELLQRHSRLLHLPNHRLVTLAPLQAAEINRLVQSLVPGIPRDARQVIAARSEGIPLFAVETVRSLVDNGIVAIAPSEGAFRLIGDLEAVEVPESLVGLLGARLDAIDVGERRLLAAASVLGTEFSAASLSAVTGDNDPRVRAGLEELVRRSVLAVSTRPVSSQRGDYRFTHEMLRRAAYDRIGRRDRKDLHLAVAEHLRSRFANDADEIAEIVANHYLDAIRAVPAAADVATLRTEAVIMLERAGSRAARSGAPARAARSYSRAASLVAERDREPERDRLEKAAELWEKAAELGHTAGDYKDVIGFATMARALRAEIGQVRAAARAQVVNARALQSLLRIDEARAALDEALPLLRDPPGTDTVFALFALASTYLSSGNCAEAERLGGEALDLGRAVPVDDGFLSRLLSFVGTAASRANRVDKAISYLREAAQLAEKVGDEMRLSVALINLSDMICGFQPAAAAEVARSALQHARRSGGTDAAAYSTANIISALLELGQWDEAISVIDEAGEQGLSDNPQICFVAGLLAALRGELTTARMAVGKLEPGLSSENVQSRANVTLVQALTSFAAGDEENALSQALEVARCIGSLPPLHETVRWAWPIASHLAVLLGRRDVLAELLRLSGAFAPEQLPPTLRAQRRLALVRSELEDGRAPVADAIYADVIAVLRDTSPYHLALELLTCGVEFLRVGDPRAAAAISEARDVAERLRAAPIVERARLLDDREAVQSAIGRAD